MLNTEQMEAVIATQKDGKWELDAREAEFANNLLASEGFAKMAGELYAHMRFQDPNNLKSVANAALAAFGVAMHIGYLMGLADRPTERGHETPIGVTSTPTSAVS